MQLIRIFRLSCLYLDEPRQSFPPVKYGSIHTDDLKSPVYDVVTPIQSNFCGSSHSIDVFTSEDSVRRFLALKPTFGTTGLKDTYSPWDSFDHFGRGQIKYVISPNPTSKQDAPSTSSMAKSTKGPPQFIVPKPGRRHSDLLTSEELTKLAERLNASSSESQLYYMYNCVVHCTFIYIVLVPLMILYILVVFLFS